MDQPDSIKDAFSKVKKDISDLRDQLIFLTEELIELKRTLNNSPNTPTQEPLNPTLLPQNPTHSDRYSDTPTHNLPLYGLKAQDSNVSIGNRGVPTDRQTDQQTNRHILQAQNPHTTTSLTSPQMAVSDIISSIDHLKNDLRSKFKLLTKQEMLVFSTIYQLEEEQFTVDYTLLAQKLKLSESSARDYVFKIAKKAPLIEKIKENNKKISLKIPLDLKKIASLQAILSLSQQQQ